MTDMTPRQLAAKALKNALTLTTGITSRDLLMGWDEQAAMAARAQAHATTAVAFALLDIADALRQQPEQEEGRHP